MRAKVGQPGAQFERHDAIYETAMSRACNADTMEPVLLRPLLHVAVPANVSAFLVNDVFLRFRLVDPALLDMLDVA